MLSLLCEAESVGVTRVDEQLVRCSRNNDVRLARVDADIASPRRFLSQYLGQSGGFGKRLAKDETAPTQVQLYIFDHRLYQVGRRGVVQAERNCLGMFLG
ncbi:hypothetical protein GCM10027213_57530 [Mycobacterium bourgelatii]